MARRMFPRDLSTFIDREFRANVWRYVLQSLMATAAIAGILFFFDPGSQMGVVTGLGATAFIAFTMPHTRAAMPRSMVGGYVMCMLIAVLFYELSKFEPIVRLHETTAWGWQVFVACGLGTAIFIMVVTDTEHAPAAGAALGIMLNPWTYVTLASVLFGVGLMALLRGLLAPHMLNLCSPHPLGAVSEGMAPAPAPVPPSEESGT